ncbi:MAG: Gfo/Idh/MocA family oxidoreductase [Armatimonadetes bacterium]|nr:Gfo/Idh/MocA family oxidoreductase [Armatimonadota bacterium]MDW8027899.1 Gfo/Idh/MocA family oxidoreductase [Armatimonadota bacterium]
MSMEAPIKLGLIGCGGIARAHLNACLQLSHLFCIVACCDVRKEMAEKFAQSAGGASVFTDYREMLSHAEIDAVDITLPHHLHAEVAIAAAEAGKHVLVEKPMANNLAEAKSMVDAADKHGVTLMVAQSQRYMAEHREIKRLLEEKTIGQVLYVRASVDQHLASIRPPNDWLFKRSLAGGGSVISIGVHKIDLLRWLIGEIVAVFAVERQSPINPGMDCEDISVAILEFEKGVVADLASLYAAKASPWGELMAIYGTEGVIHNIGGWHINSDKVSEWKGKFVKLEIQHEDPFRNELEHFGNCLLNGREPLTSGRDNLKTMAVVEAIYRSAKEQTRLSLSEIWAT